jgi:toxin ParE1/3/4
MKYRITVAADRDIIELYVLGANQFGASQSERYVDDLFDTFELLADNPRMARERLELNPPVRLHPHRAHMIALHHPRRGYPDCSRAAWARGLAAPLCVKPRLWPFSSKADRITSVG